MDKFKWMQVSGDVNPGTYGATIAQSDGITIDLVEIMPVLEHLSEREAAEIGFPFWPRTTTFWLSDLDPATVEAKRALESCGWEYDGEHPDPMQVALALFEYGHAEEGPAGWAADVLPSGRVLWWSEKYRRGARFFQDDEAEFRRIVKDVS